MNQRNIFFSVVPAVLFRFLLHLKKLKDYHVCYELLSQFKNCFSPCPTSIPVTISLPSTTFLVILEHAKFSPFIGVCTFCASNVNSLPTHFLRLDPSQELELCVNTSNSIRGLFLTAFKVALPLPFTFPCFKLLTSLNLF